MLRIEIAFTTLSIRPSISRSMRTSGNYVGSNTTKFEEDMKIDERNAPLVKREPEGKRIFKCWTCKEYGHFASNFPKRENKHKRKDRKSVV